MAHSDNSSAKNRQILKRTCIMAYVKHICKFRMKIISRHAYGIVDYENWSNERVKPVLREFFRVLYYSVYRINIMFKVKH